MTRRTHTFTIRVLSASLAIAMMIASPAFAQYMPLEPAGDTVMSRLPARCDEIRATLRRLHTSDSLLRVNTGQSYNSISARLMARLNSRLVLNRIDGTKLVDIAAQFDRDRAAFATAYTEYETALSALLKADCKDRATEYYAAILTARDARLRLAEIVQALNASLRAYQVAVEELQSIMRVGEDPSSLGVPDTNAIDNSTPDNAQNGATE